MSCAVVSPSTVAFSARITSFADVSFARENTRRSKVLRANASSGTACRRARDNGIRACARSTPTTATSATATMMKLACRRSRPCTGFASRSAQTFQTSIFPSQFRARKQAAPSAIHAFLISPAPRAARSAGPKPAATPAAGSGARFQVRRRRSALIQIQVRPSPGGSGRPPVTSSFFPGARASALRRASACAATIRSSTISFSPGFSSESSIFTP